MSLIISCEHASAAVPPDYHAAGIPAELLNTHRAWDPGAAPVAQALAAHFACPLFLGRATRLLVDLNRSPGSRNLYSDYSRTLPVELRQKLASTHADYQQGVRAAVTAALPAWHLSVHSFTPALDPPRRDFDLGLLYDPARAGERQWADSLAAGLKSCGWSVRRNAPYRGTADGLTRILRREHMPAQYAGMELEINQRLLDQPRRLAQLAPDLIPLLIARHG